MKYIITSQNRFIKENKSVNLLDKSAEEIVDIIGSWEGFNSKEDAIEEINYSLNGNFPHGLNNIPETVTLYRVLLIYDDYDINEDLVGECFVSDKDNIDRSFLDNIGILSNWSDGSCSWDDLSADAKLWLLTCETKSYNIDFKATLLNRLTYPRENEFTLKPNSNVKILNKEVLNINQIK